MRKLIAITFALLIATSAFASPNDSSERNSPGLVARIVRHIRNIIRPTDDGGPIAPIPSSIPTP